MSSVPPPESELAGDELDDADAPPSAAAATKKQARRERLKLLIRRPSFIIGAIILGFWVLSALLGEFVTPHDPLGFVGPPSDSPSGEFWFGTDRLGRDVFSRVIAGARDVLIAAPTAAVLGVIGGTVLGLVMGYYRGWVDEILSRFVEALLSIPVLLVALLIITSLGTSLAVVIGTVAVLFTPVVARTVRAATLTEARLDYVTSAKLRGESGLFVMAREIFPNITGVVIVELTVRIGYAVFTFATLSFLGVGFQPPSPDWGLQVADNYELIQSGQWWMTLFPALAIASLVIGANLVADAIEGVNKA